MNKCTAPTAPDFEVIEYYDIVREWEAIPFRKRFASPRAIEICQYFVSRNHRHFLLEAKADFYAMKEQDHPDGQGYGDERPILKREKNMLFDVLMEQPLDKVNQLIALCPELVGDTVTLVFELALFKPGQLTRRLFEPKSVTAACHKLIHANIPGAAQLSLNMNLKTLAANIAKKNIARAQSYKEIQQMYHHYALSPFISAPRNPNWDNFCTIFNPNTKFLEPLYPHSKRAVIFALQNQAYEIVCVMKSRGENVHELIRDMLDSELFSMRHVKRGVSYDVHAEMRTLLLEPGNNV